MQTKQKLKLKLTLNNRKHLCDVVIITEDNGLKKRCRTEIKGSQQIYT